MGINNDKKAEILIVALQERYNSLHKIRDRAQGVGFWILGIFFGAGGWILQDDFLLTTLHKIVGILGVVAIIIVLRFFYLADLRKGFKKQQQVAVKIETALHLFSEKFFDNSNESIYPEGWRKSGTSKGDGKFFNTTFLLLYIGTAFLSIAILMS